MLLEVGGPDSPRTYAELENRLQLDSVSSFNNVHHRPIV